MWFRVNDGLFSDPKWSKTASKSRALWVTAGSWCSQYLTDGNVPRNKLRALGGTPAAAQNLVDVGLWEETETGWSFHDWKDYNPSRETVLQQRAETAERVKKHRQKQQEDRDRRNGVSNTAPARAQFPTRPDPLSTSVAGESSSSSVSEREGDDGPTTTELIERGAGRLKPVDLQTEAEAFRAHNRGRWPELHDWRRAWSGWLTKAAERNRPTPTPDRPECPDHPGQPTGSVACPECAKVVGPPPAPLRALRDAG